MNRHVSLFTALYLVATLLASAAFARIGETEQQIEARYGAPVRVLHDDAMGAKRRLYSFKEFTINVAFLEGKSECELISKRDATAKVDPSEAKALLALNAPSGMMWNQQRPGAWTRSDGKLVAKLVFGVLEIYTKRFDRKISGVVDEIEAEKTKGF